MSKMDTVVPRMRLKSFHVLIGETQEQDPAAEGQAERQRVEQLRRVNPSKYRHLTIDVSESLLYPVRSGHAAPLPLQAPRHKIINGNICKWDMKEALVDDVTDQLLWQRKQIHHTIPWLVQAGIQPKGQLHPTAVATTASYWLPLLRNSACHYVTALEPVISKLKASFRPQTEEGAERRLLLKSDPAVQDEMLRWWCGLRSSQLETQRNQGEENTICTLTLATLLYSMYKLLLSPYVPWCYCLSAAVEDIAINHHKFDTSSFVTYSSFMHFLFELMDSWTVTTLRSEAVFFLRELRKQCLAEEMWLSQAEIVAYVKTSFEDGQSSALQRQTKWHWSIPLIFTEKRFDEPVPFEERAWVDYPRRATEQLINVLSETGGCHSIVLSGEESSQYAINCEEVYFGTHDFSAFRAGLKISLRESSSVEKQLTVSVNVSDEEASISIRESSATVALFSSIDFSASSVSPHKEKKARRRSLGYPKRRLSSVGNSSEIISDLEEIVATCYAPQVNLLSVNVEYSGGNPNSFEDPPLSAEDNDHEVKDDSHVEPMKSTAVEDLDWGDMSQPEPQAFRRQKPGFTPADQSGYRQQHWSAFVDFDVANMLNMRYKHLRPMERLQLHVSPLLQQMALLSPDQDDFDRLFDETMTCHHAVSGIVSGDDFSTFIQDEDIARSRSMAQQRTSNLTLLQQSGWNPRSDDVQLHFHDEYCVATAQCSFNTLLQTLSDHGNSVEGLLLFGHLTSDEFPPDDLNIRLYKGGVHHPKSRVADESALVTQDGAPSSFTFDIFIKGDKEVDFMLRRLVVLNGGLPVLRRLVQLIRESTGEVVPDPKFIGRDKSHITLVVEVSPNCKPGPAWNEVKQRRKKIAPGNFIQSRSFAATLMERLVQASKKSDADCTTMQGFIPTLLGGIRPRMKGERRERANTDVIPEPLSSSSACQARVPFNRQYAFNYLKSKLSRLSVQDEMLRSQSAPLEDDKSLLHVGTTRSLMSITTKSSEFKEGLHRMPQTTLPPLSEMEGLPHFASPGKPGEGAFPPVTNAEQSFIERMYKRARSSSPDSKNVQKLADRIKTYTQKKLLGSGGTACVHSTPLSIVKQMLNRSLLDESQLESTTVGSNIKLRPLELKLPPQDILPTPK